MFPHLMPAVAIDLELSGAAATLEIGGLLFLVGGVGAILYGMLQGGDDTHAGSRAVGYGVAITAAAGLSLYMSTELGGDPLARVVQATWVYPFVTIVGCLLYASRTINQSIKTRRRVKRDGRPAAATLASSSARTAVRTDAHTRPARHAVRPRAGGTRPRRSRSSRDMRP